MELPALPADRAEWRLVWYPRLLLGALGLALAIVLLAGDGSGTAGGRVGGDYPAFYAAGAIVLDGAVDALYDPVRQSVAQADLLGDESDYLAFAYPPHVALAYAPLAALPYRVSYLIHTGLMAGAVLLALHLLRPILGCVDRRFWVAAAASLSAYPLFRAVGAGQNTAITLLILAAIWRALDDGREAWAGVAAGLLLFRPQYAIPLIGLLWLGRHRRAVVASLAVAVATWAVNASVLGPDWVGRWWRGVRPFLETDAEVNAHNSISWLGFGEALFGTDHATATAAAWVLAATTAGVLAVMWSRPRRFDLDVRLAATSAGIVLLSPHALFYDAGLLVLTVLVAVDRSWLDRRSVAVAWALTCSHVFAGTLGATPVALLVMVGFAVLVGRAWAPGRVRQPVGITA